MRTRDWRRSQHRRILSKRIEQNYNWWWRGPQESNAEHRAKFMMNARYRVSTGTQCSKHWCCASPRATYGNGAGGLTKQELFAILRLAEEKSDGRPQPSSDRAWPLDP